MKRESSGNKSGRPRASSGAPRKTSAPRGGASGPSRRPSSSGSAPYRKTSTGGDFFKKDSDRKPYASRGDDDKPYDRKPRTGGDFKAGSTRKPYASRGAEDKPYDRKPRSGGDFFKKDSDRKPYASRGSDDKPYDRKPRTGGDFKEGSTRKPYASRGGEDKPYDRKPRTGGDFKAGSTRKPYASRSSEDKPYDRKPRTEGDFKAGSTRKPYASRSSSEDKPYDRKPRTEGGNYSDRPKRAYTKSSESNSFDKDSRKPYSDKRGDKPAYGDKSKKAYGGADSFKDRKNNSNLSENKPEDNSTHKERIGDNAEFPTRTSRGRKENFSADPGKGKFTKKSELKGFKPKFNKDAPAEDFRFAKPGARGKKLDIGEEFVSTSKSQAKERATEQALKVGESIRLNRFISNAGVCSRREADELIGAGLVSINSEVVTELGSKVKAGDVVRFNGEKLNVEAKVYILLNKPKDAITTSDDPDGRNTVMDIFEGKLRERIFPIGRLDRNTTGVLLLTNDGELANRLMHPKYEIKKVYKATLDKNLKPADLWTLSNGVELEDGYSKPDALANSDPKNKHVVGVEIHSGKNRIIHRMFEHLGYSVEKLDRVLYAGIEKGILKRGAWRELNEKELKNLKKSVQMK